MKKAISFTVVIVIILITIFTINLCTLTEYIKDRNNSNNSEANVEKNTNKKAPETTNPRTVENNKYNKNTANISKTMIISKAPWKMMTEYNFELSTANPGNFNKNLLQQHQGQQIAYEHSHQRKRLQEQSLDNKHLPYDYVENTFPTVTESEQKDTLHTTTMTNSNNKIRTNATIKGSKRLLLSASHGSNNEKNIPFAAIAASTSSTTSTVNFASNGFPDKINVTNQQDEPTGIGYDDDGERTDDDYYQAEQSDLKPLQIYYRNITKNNNIGISTRNESTNIFSNNNNDNFPSISSFFEKVEQAELRLSPDKHSELLLHRRKRYLTFPEGSSFQLVFDLIIGIVDYTNYAILGITCSVAWELPSKPPSEIIDNFREKLNEGKFGLQRRNDSVASKEDFNYIETQNRNSTKYATNIGYENSWKPQKYIDTGKWNYNEKKYSTPYNAAKYYEYKTRNKYNYNNNDISAPSVSDLTSGDSFVLAQRKTLNERPTNWQWHLNRQKPDKAYPLYDQNYSTRQKNYGWYGTDKSQYVALGDWHQNRISGDNSNTRDDYTAKSVHFDERQEKDKKVHTNWQKNSKWWQPYSPPWHDRPLISNGNIPPNNARNGKQRKILKEPPRHRIYPVFGRKKRSLENPLRSSEFELKLERIHLREQLQSRQKLYEKIERIFQTRGHNGTVCVLRGLCETGQRQQHLLHQHEHQYRRHYSDHQQQEPHSTASHESEPQSFITELLRAIFALPKYKQRSKRCSYAGSHHHYQRPSTEINLNDDLKATHEMVQREFVAHVSRHYREAYAYDGNCAEQFASCEHSIWTDTIRNCVGSSCRHAALGRAFKM